MPITNDSLPALACWWSAALVVPVRAGLVVSSARYVRVVVFGGQQRSRRSSRTHDPARGTPFTLLVTRMLDVFVTIIVSARNEQDNFQDILFETGSKNKSRCLTPGKP